ncbi:hypothetical protein [Sphingomonas profundi]|uniref:hypothetical protein n=1 Tax=Alterirhizorhabdus profundi TaxID=2681549 RepID=UPI0012E98AD0|nr:hypothetical protein [Sphingomonas profundi]
MIARSTMCATRPGRRRAILLLLPLALLAGCASRESRVEAALVKAGVSARLAACLAPRLAERLSDDQLRALAAAARRPPGDDRKARVGDVVARVAGTGDPAIIDAVTKSGIHCALKG